MARKIAAVKKAAKRTVRAKAARKKAAKAPARPRLSPRELEREIQKTAYELYARRGYFHGRDMADWLEAERIVLSKLR